MDEGTNERPSSGCPDDDALAELIEGLARPETREAVATHADGCSNCRALLRQIARQLEDAPDEQGDATGVEAPDGCESGSRVARGARIGRFVAERVLGRGALGTVYLARDPELERLVAVKVLHVPGDPAARRAWTRHEARSMARLSHPNVVTVFDVGTHADRVFIAMEHVEGETLQSWLKSPRTVAEIAERFHQAALGLSAAHECGLIHRDFKADNVLVSAAGRVKVSDFGLAALTGAPHSVPPIPSTPRSSSARREPQHLAPELMAGAVADARSDIYSFCVALREALYPDRGDSGPGGERRVPGRVPRRLRTMLRGGLMDDPSVRLGSMAQVTEALRPRSRRWLAPAAAVVVIGACVGAAASGIGRSRTCEASVSDPWVTGDRARIERFLASADPVTERFALERLLFAMDEYADWHDEVRCSAELATEDPTKRCLDGASTHFRILARELSSRQKLDPVAALEALGQLPRPEQCGPSGGGGYPSAHGEYEHDLARLRVLSWLGPAEQATGLAEQILAIGNTRGEAYLVAEASMVLAQWLDDTEPDRARESLRNAMAAAERTGDPRLRARSWLRWLRFISMFDHDIDGARQWLPLVSQLIERTGDVTLECSMWRLQGILAFEGGDYGAAKQAFETSLGRRREQAGVNPLHRAYDLYYLAQAVHAAGDDASAFEHVESALEIMRTTVGPGHPTVFDFVSLRGKLLHALGDHDEAVMELSRAVSHLRDTVGPDSSHLASILLNLADALAAAGDRVAAEATAEQGRNILERNLGRDHNYTQTARLRHGRSLMGLERFAEARDLFAEFVARVDEPTEQVIGRFNLGTAAFSLGLYRDAIEVLEAAREGIDVLPEPRRHELARLIGAVLGSALAAAGDDDPAHAALGLVLEDWEPEDDEGRRWFCTAAVARARAAFVLHRPVEDDHCLTSCRGWQADSRDPRLIAATEELAGWTAG